MELVTLLQPHVLEAVLTDPELPLFPILLGIGREVPRVHLIPGGKERGGEWKEVEGEGRSCQMQFDGEEVGK